MRRFTTVLFAGLVAGSSTLALVSNPARADDCILDSNDNGAADLTDTDGGATSSGADNRLACGVAPPLRAWPVPQSVQHQTPLEKLRQPWEPRLRPKSETRPQ